MRIRNEIKQGLKRALILFVVFVAALIFFELLSNHKNVDKTKDMEPATLPVIYMQLGTQKINRLIGYTNEMDSCYMRDDILPCQSTEDITLIIEDNDYKIKDISYKVVSTDGEDTLTSGEAKISSGQAVISGLSALNENEEYVLILSVNDDEIYYYTRLINTDDDSLSGAIEFARYFHEEALKEGTSEELATYVETDETGNNSDFATVDIHSSLSQICFDDLAIEQYSDADISVKEIDGLYSVVTIDYIATTSEDDDIRYYNVDEYYRIRYSDDRAYLLDYERSMEQIFNPEGQVTSDSSIVLGIRNNTIEYQANETASKIAFVQAGELWEFDTQTSYLSRVFSFRSDDEIDLRENCDEHNIRIISVDEMGDMDFVIYGYMNSGDYEGKVGIAAYHYDANASDIELQVFVPISRSYETFKGDLGQLLYVSADGNFYFMLADNVYQANTQTLKINAFVEETDSRSYAVSESGRYFAIATQDNTQIEIYDLSTCESKTISAKKGRRVQPLCYMNEDLIYGIAKKNSIIYDSYGNESYAMYKALILDEDLQKQKDYSSSGYYITGAYVNKDTIYFERAVKKGATYETASKDTVLINTSDDAQYITFDNTSSGSYKYIKVLSIDGQITGEVRFVKDRLVVTEDEVYIEFAPQTSDGDMYYVYASGCVLENTSDLTKAISDANDNMGVVIDSKQSYVWKRCRSSYSDPLFTASDAAKDYSVTLDKALAAMVAYETGSDAAIDSNATIVENIENNIPSSTALDLTGCSLDDMLYFLDNGIPVLTKISSGRYVVLTGYNESKIYYYDGSQNSTYNVSQSSLKEQINEAGDIYITYRLNDKGGN